MQHNTDNFTYVLSLDDLIKSNGFQNHLYTDNLQNYISAFIITLSSGIMYPPAFLTFPLVWLIYISDLTCPNQHWFAPTCLQTPSSHLHFPIISPSQWYHSLLTCSGPNPTSHTVPLINIQKFHCQVLITLPPKYIFFQLFLVYEIIIFINYLPLMKVPLPESRKLFWATHSQQVKWCLAHRRHLIKFVEWINRHLYLESLWTCVSNTRNFLLYKESGPWLVNNGLGSCFILFTYTYVFGIIKAGQYWTLK